MTKATTSKATMADATARALWGVLQSPNEADSNLEAANVVDAIFAAGRIVCHGLKQVAANDHSNRVADALAELARQVGRVADALGGGAEVANGPSVR
jgi:hypothetical protein